MIALVLLGSALAVTAPASPAPGVAVDDVPVFGEGALVDVVSTGAVRGALIQGSGAMKLTLWHASRTRTYRDLAGGDVLAGGPGPTVSTGWTDDTGAHVQDFRLGDPAGGVTLLDSAENWAARGSGFALDVNQHGAAIASWYGGPYATPNQAAYRTPDGTWLEPVGFPGGGGNSWADAVIDSSGRAMVVWSARDAEGVAVMAARTDEEGIFGAPVEVARSSSEQLRGVEIAVDRDAEVAVVWGDDNGIRSRRMAGDGTWGPVRTVSEDGGLPSYDGGLTSRPGGGFALGWQAKESGSYWTMGALSRAGGGWRPALRVPSAGPATIEVRTLPQAAGGVRWAWLEDAETSARIRTAVWDAHGVGPTVTLAQTHGVAMSTVGIPWLSASGPLVGWTSSGRDEQPKVLALDLRAPRLTRLAVTAEGRVVHADWSASDAGSGPWRYLTERRVGDRQWGRPSSFAEPRTRVGRFPPGVRVCLRVRAVDEDGNLSKPEVDCARTAR